MLSDIMKDRANHRNWATHDGRSKEQTTTWEKLPTAYHTGAKKKRDKKEKLEPLLE